MAFPNISDILTTTIEARSRKIADNVTKNNGLLAKLSQGGRIKTFSGGHKILEEVSFAENGNAGYYSGYDVLPVAAQDVLSAAEYTIKQAAVPVIISGLEMLQNSGREALIDLMEARLAVAEASLSNLICNGLYSDGTGSANKQIDGLDKAVPAGVATGRIATGTYGNIDRSNGVTGVFWRPYYQKNAAPSAANIQGDLNALWSNLVRGADRPDLIVMGAGHWGFYVASLQALQRFTSPESANLGFPTLKFMDCDVILDGGIGGNCGANTTFMLNSRYLKYRPHASRNCVALAPNKRYAINQDAEVQIIGWAGNLTCSGQQFQGRYGTT